MSADEYDPFHAFRDAPSPGNEIAPHDCLECDEFRGEFVGRTPKEIPDSVLEKRAETLPLFSPIAWRYFLPAFLAYAIRHPRSVAGECILKHFEAACDDPVLYEGQSIDALSGRERDALREFFDLLVPRWDDFIERDGLRQVRAKLDAT